MKHHFLNFHGNLLSLEEPVVMGIMNLTPDSFYSNSRINGEEAIHLRANSIREEGGKLIDVGAYSSRPGAKDISAKEEMNRLRPALKILRDEFSDLPISVDTFRADVARMAVEEYGARIINDISGGGLDANMYKTVADLQACYILMHMKSTPKEMQQHTDYPDGVAIEVLDYFIPRVKKLHSLGVKDVIIDMGYGFAKTLEQNYELMAYEEKLSNLLELPRLVGVSRKSMIYKALNTSPEKALTGTTVLHTYALLHGANILRVHDVHQAVEAIQLTQLLLQAEKKRNLNDGMTEIFRQNGENLLRTID